MSFPSFKMSSFCLFALRLHLCCIHGLSVCIMNLEARFLSMPVCMYMDMCLIVYEEVNFYRSASVPSIPTIPPSFYAQEKNESGQYGLMFIRCILLLYCNHSFGFIQNILSSYYISCSVPHVLVSLVLVVLFSESFSWPWMGVQR